VKFLNLMKYRDLDRIASARAAHFEYADGLRNRGELAIGGPLLDEQGRRIGLLFIYEASSRYEAMTFVQRDPFYLADAISTYELNEWRIRGLNLDLLVRANLSGDRNPRSQGQGRFFVNYAKYCGDKRKLASAREAHWGYDRTLKGAGKLALAGPFANDEGGMFVYHVDSREAAVSCVEHDPFLTEGVFREHELFEWLIEGVNPDLLVSDFAAVSA
jgi:hypothetical protein